jgi:hypothetical protein
VLAAGAAGAVGAQVFKWRQSFLEGELLRVSPADCAGLQFPPGHPQLNRIYVLHPFQRTRYLTLEAFHHTLFTDKLSEVLRLYAALGATTVQAVRVSGHTKVEDFLSGGSPAEEEEPVVLSQTFSPTQPPHLPGNLVWLEHEPQWKLGAEKRIHGTGPLPSLELQWTEDFSINTGLTSRLRRAGWKFDAQQIHFSPTIWRFKAE